MPAAIVAVICSFWNGLLNAAERAALPRCDCGIKSCVSSDHQDDGLGIHLQKLFERAQSADAGHRHVKQHDVKSAAAVSFETFFTSLCEIDAIALGRQQRFQHFTHDLLVVDDEDGSFSGIALFGFHQDALV